MFNLRWERLIPILAATVIVLALFSPLSTGAASAPTEGLPPSMEGQVISAARVGQTQGALRDMPVRVDAPKVDSSEFVGGNMPVKSPIDLPYPRKVTNPNANKPVGPSPVISVGKPSNSRPVLHGSDARIGDPLASSDIYAAWNGLNQGDNRTLFGYGFVPPDTQGDTSGNVYDTGYYVEVVNSNLAVWDYSQANVYGAWPKTVLGPMPIFDLWQGFGGPCEYDNDGDPIVLFDEQADRWLISQFALPAFNYGPGAFASDMSECVAISQTNDPTGAYYLYEFPAGYTGIDDDYDPGTPQVTGYQKMPDYPKFGIWQDSYYMTVNQFDVYFTGDWAGGGVYVFDRDAMLTGTAGAYFYFDPFSAFDCSMGTYYTTESNPWCFLGGLLPADNDGPWAPGGTPEYLVMFEDDAWSTPAYTVGDQLDILSVDTDWTGATATMSYDSILPVDAFDSEVCPNYQRTCIKQPDTTATVDAISDRLMYRLQYRNFGDYQAMVVNHTVDMNDPAGHAGVRWYQLVDSGSGWTVGQQGDFSPDSDSRWMGSAAMDEVGNIALGYSVSSTSTYPSIRYTHHLASDPVGTMRTEATIWAGGGSQFASALYGSQYARWGDYSMMSIAPDGCDFVYTNEYYRGNTPLEWYTSMGNFGMDSCWYGDIIPPDTSILTGPADPAHSLDATFTFDGTDGETAVAGFECSLNGSAWEDCTSPKTYDLVNPGMNTFEVRAIDLGYNFDQTPASYTWDSGFIAKVFRSKGLQDGWILESGENTNKGGSLNETSKRLYIGDNSLNKQYRSILSFNTAILPDTAQIIGGSLQMKRSKIVGTDPFSTHGDLVADMKVPYFSTSASLQLSDFRAGADVFKAATFGGPVSRWYRADLVASAYGAVNLSGTTQFRVRFMLDDDNDATADFIKFFSGNAALTVRPKLIIYYYVP